VKPRYLLLLAVASAAVVALVVVAAVSTGGDARQRPPNRAAGSRFSGSLLPRGLRVPPFSLHDQNGNVVTRASLAAGRPAVVMFLGAPCRVACLLATSQAKGALDDLLEPATAVAFSVDPARDSAAAARRLVARVGMRGRLRLLIGPRRALERVWRGFGVDPRGQRDPHHARLVLVDPRGLQRVGYPLSQATPERIASDLRILAGE
jgi:protein SCO1